MALGYESIAGYQEVIDAIRVGKNKWDNGAYGFEVPYNNAVGKTVESLHKRLTPERARQLDFEIAKLTEQMNAEYEAFKASFNTSSWEGQAFFTSPASTSGRREAPNKYKELQYKYDLAALERYGNRPNWQSTLKGIGMFAGAAVGLSTLATAVNSGTLFSGSSWFSNATSPTSLGTKAVEGATSLLPSGGGVTELGNAMPWLEGAGSVGTASSILGGLSTVGDVVGAISDIASPILGSGLADGIGTYFEAQQAKEKSKQQANQYLAQAGEYDFLATQAGKNKNVALSNLIFEQQRTLVEQEKLRRRNQKVIGTQKAGYGASGVTTSGSAEDVLIDTAQQGALDIALESFDSKQRQRNFLIQAEGLEATQQFALKNKATAEANAADAIRSGNEISKYLTGKAAFQGISAIPGVVKGVSSAASAIKNLLD